MENNFMRAALDGARLAMSAGEVPVGAVIVKDGKIIASAHNMRESGGGATAHAELKAIEEACRILGSWRLSGCELYVTLEPCPMCAGAIINARLDRVVYGAKDPRMGALGSVMNMNAYPLGHKVRVESGVCETECLELLREFFKKTEKGRRKYPMKPQDMEIKVRTTCEMSLLCVAVAIILMLASITALFLVKTFVGVALVLLVPAVYFAAVFFLAGRNKNALVMNVIDTGGVKNRYMGNVLCDLSWGEIGDFGVVEVKRGFFSGRYIYMSRVFVASSVRKDLIKKYDPRVCVVFPYTKQVCRAMTRLSGGRIDVR